MFAGFRDFLQGLRMLRAPGVARYLWAPLSVSLLLIVLLTSAIISVADQWITAAIASLPEMLGFLDIIIRPLVYLLTLVAGAWFSGFLATLVASPFLGDLAAHAEYLITGVRPTANVPFHRTLWPALRRELTKLAWHLPRLLVLLAIGFIPVVNVFAPALWLIFGAWLLTAQFSDYVSENRHAPFSATLQLMRQHRARALGFGLLSTAAMAVPFLNFIAVPASVLGGTVLNLSLAHTLSPGKTARPAP